MENLENDFNPIGTEVAIDEQASKGQRVLAFLIDAIAVSVVGGLIGGILGNNNGAISSLISIGYFLTRDALPFLDGQSLGKKVLNLRAIDANTGEALTGNWATSAIRNISVVVPILNFIEMFVLLFGKDGNRLGDGWAKTTVVVTK